MVLGDQVQVWNWTHIRSGASIGHGVVIGEMVHIGPRVRVGYCSRIGNKADIHEPAEIGHHVFIGPMAFIGNDRTPNVCKPYTPQPVKIGDYAIIGAAAKIMGGVEIGEGAVVGMGAVVLQDVAPGEIVVGNPARFLRHRNKHGVGTVWEHWAPLSPEDICPFCRIWEQAGEAYARELASFGAPNHTGGVVFWPPER